MVVGLPSKKIVLVLVACTIGIGAIGFAAFAAKNNTKTNSVEHSATNGSSAQIKAIELALQTKSEEDDDADGLANWEETLWKTDPKNADSDSDGTKDGEEVKQGRNPLVAGPNDTLSTAHTGTKEQNKATIQLDNTETAKISRDLFTYYLEAKKSGLPLDVEIKNQIVKQSLQNKTLESDLKKYTVQNVRIAATSDLHAYGNALGLAFQAAVTSNSISEIEILTSALETNSPAKVAELEPIIKGYEAILKQLSLVAVPESLVRKHVDLMNAMNRVLTDIEAFKIMFDDPILGLVSVGSYFENVKLLQSIVLDIENTFEKNGVTFEQYEAGYIFAQPL